MAGAEGERRFDFDADAVDRNAGAVVRAVDDEAAGGDRPQSGQAFAHPVGLFHVCKAEHPGGLRTGGRTDCGAHRFFVDAPAEMDGDLPAAAAGVEQTHGESLCVEQLRQAVGDAMRGLFVRFELR